MSDNNISRQPKGRPTGGQFAATVKSESTLDTLASSASMSGDPVRDAEEVLREKYGAEQVFGSADLADDMTNWLSTADDNLLDRVAFVVVNDDNVTVHSLHPEMDDYDTFKSEMAHFDGAVVFDRDRTDDFRAFTYPDGFSGYDFSPIASTINSARAPRA